MNIEKIRKRLSGGFRPFIIHTSDGRKYKVPHPEFILIGRYDVAVEDKRGDIDILDPLHITSLKVINPGKRKNGASRR